MAKITFAYQGAETSSEISTSPIAYPLLENEALTVVGQCEQVYGGKPYTVIVCERVNTRSKDAKGNPTQGALIGIARSRLAKIGVSPQVGETFNFHYLNR